MALLGCLTYVILPCGTHWYVERETRRAITMLRSEDSKTFQEGARILNRFRWVADFVEIVHLYEVEESPERRNHLAVIYLDLFGEEIERRLELSRD